MPLGLELVLGYNGALTGSTTYDALTPGVNQSFAVRNFTSGTCELLEIWAADSVGAFNLSIKSPKMHDDVFGVLLAGTPKNQGGTSTFNPQTLLPGYATQQLYATDALSVTANGAANDVFCMSYLVRYTDISGIAARLYNWQTIAPLAKNLVGISVSPATSGTAGSWGTSATLSSGGSRLKANTDYAVYGYTTSKPCTAVSILGTDTGNLMLGGPGFWDQRWGGDYFIRASQQYGFPMIPVINSNNQGNVTINVADTATSSTIVTTLLMAELSQLLPTPQAGV